MLDKYKQARAADLAFLRDMRNLARRLDQPRTTVVLSDQFQDGNFEDNPKWRVTSGVYWIEKNWGGATERRQQTSQGTAAQLFG